MPDTLLTRNVIAGVAINAAANNDQIIPCEGDGTLVVLVDMTGAANGDLTVAVNPLEADNATVMPIAVPVVQSIGPTVNGGHVYFYGQYDVTGLEMVRLRLTNNNAGAQTITRASWRLA